MHRSLALLAALLLAACGRIVPDAQPPGTAMPPVVAPGAGQTAGLAAASPGPGVGLLRIAPDDARTALASFVESCPELLRRTDQTGLTRREDWQPACADAPRWPAVDAARFFDTHFETARIGDGRAFATGYFEPEIRGSRTRIPGYEVPVYSVPPELVRDWHDDIPQSERTGRAPLGRRDASGRFVPFYERSEIEDGALANRGLEIAWAADPIEMFFLQIQGSGLLRLPDGSLMRIGYAGQNGREYVGIGALMRERGLIGGDTGYETSMQGIVRYLRDHPAEGRAIMRENRSWIFFRELPDPDGLGGPLGSIGVPVRRGSSVAVDPTYVPYGAPVWLDLDRDVADGLWIAQDTGGAIKGANRFDTFWGNGPDASQIAGGMLGRGDALVLVPKGTLARRDLR
ncbi:murein transglycosylase A [Qipengyuania sp. MTN3-11]|uniref:murein transglycosylase A n=1 Tax=Qipengyuania sp. MTN3-11 TaxID=3056557 RepID=UPI0036F4163A